MHRHVIRSTGTCNYFDLREFLTDRFGDDYLYWLEDAPNADELCEELEALKR